MTRLDEFFQKYPLISLAAQSDQDKIFDLLERTSLKAGGLQIGFDRRPDFFTFLKNQGPRAFVFLMSNENGEVHGMACISVRPMFKGDQQVSLAYASDLRTTPQLSRAARLQWRSMYAELIRLMPSLPEFEQPEAVLTAVWNDNEPAQRALVRKSSKLQVEYVPFAEYTALSVMGRLTLKKSPYIREAVPENRDLIFHWICHAEEENGLAWNHEEFLRTLHHLGRKPEDFLIYQKDGQVEAIALVANSLPGRKVILHSLPKGLVWLARLLKVLFGLKVVLGEELRTQSLLFFRARRPERSEELMKAYLHYLMEIERPLPRSERTQVYSLFFWGDHGDLVKNFLRSGFISTSLGAKIYKVVPKGGESSPEKSRLGLEQLEVGLL